MMEWVSDMFPPTHTHTVNNYESEQSIWGDCFQELGKMYLWTYTLVIN